MQGKFGHVAASGALLLAVAATPGAAQTELTVWGDTLRVQSYAAYDELTSDVSLNVVTVAPEETVTRLQLALRTGTGVPDLVFISDAPNSAMLASRQSDYLMRLEGRVDAGLLADFYPNANAPCIVNGELVCLRSDLAHNHIWYDSVLMEELRLEVPQTWEAFEALGERLAALDRGYFLGSAVDPYGLYGMLMAAGCDMATPVAGEDDTILVNMQTEDCLRAVRMIDRMGANGTLIDSGPFDPGFVERASAGNLVLYVGPTWFGEFILRGTYGIPESRIATALPPRWEAEAAPVTWSFGGGGFGVWKNTEAPEAAIAMLEWLTTSEANQRNAVTFPPYGPVTLLWGERLTADPYYVGDVFAAMEAAAEFADPNYGARLFDMPSVIGKIVSPVMASGGSLETVLPDLEAEIRNTATVFGYRVVTE
jgi:multiple sugar transport system substrate-binding protein